MQIDNEDFYIDLLVCDRELKRLIAIELKTGEFRAEHKGQMELYLRRPVKHEQEAARTRRSASYCFAAG